MVYAVKDRLEQAYRVAKGISSRIATLKKLARKGTLSEEHIILQSGLFDAAYYAGTPQSERLGMRPVEHYMRTGEADGLKPSKFFDPWYYAGIATVPAGQSLLAHFIQNGLGEGKLPYDPDAPDDGTPHGSYTSSELSQSLKLPNLPRGGHLKTVLLIVHQASRTGAPILGWNLLKRLQTSYTVIVLMTQGGELESVFARDADVLVGPLTKTWLSRPEIHEVIAKVVDKYDIHFAVANSVETKDYASELSEMKIPVVLLVHEFSNLYPSGGLAEVYRSVSKIVFPAAMVRASSTRDYAFLDERETFVLPQGPSDIPVEQAAISYPDANLPPAAQAPILDPKSPKLRPSGSEGAFLVIGLGTVDYRKGVDLFISVASVVKILAPDRKFRFVWIGHGYQPGVGYDYSSYLYAQLQQCSLEGDVDILDAVSDLDPIYADMQALLLSSRLDPLPNVAMDCALRGIPIVCFDKASGMAEILARHPETKFLVAPHQDARAAAEIIVELAQQPSLQRELSTALKTLARSVFEMDVYVQKLTELGESAAAETKAKELVR